MSVYYDFDAVDAFTTGALGQPGQRTFFFQIRRLGERVTIKCEKQQAAALAAFIHSLVSDMPAPSDRPLEVAMELTDPSDIAFILGGVGLGFDSETERVIIQFEEVMPVDEEGEPLPDFNAGKVRVALTIGQATAFADVTNNVVAAGRPSCFFCGHPIDPDGHTCTRMN